MNKALIKTIKEFVAFVACVVVLLVLVLLGTWSWWFFAAAMAIVFAAIFLDMYQKNKEK